MNEQRTLRAADELPSGELVLIVEDNVMNADVLRENLLDAGYTLLLAVNGAAGVAMTNEMLPDIVLMDVNLPLLDGLSATRLLKQTSTTQGIPIIALTARAMAGDRESCLSAGCDDYVSKPIDIDDLLERMQHLLDHRPRSFVDRLQRMRAATSRPTLAARAITTDVSLSPEPANERIRAEFQQAEQRVLQLDEELAERDRLVAALIAERDEALRVAERAVPEIVGIERSTELATELELAGLRIKELEADIRSLQGRHEELRKAFLQLHRTVARAAEDALHQVAFGPKVR